MQVKFDIPTISRHNGNMRSETSKAKTLSFMDALAERSRGRGRIYLTGGASALLLGWREMTIDVDVKADPEPGRFFEAIAELKDSLDINIELASPDLFLPELPGWRERSMFIKRVRDIEYFHYDFYAQALAKIARSHARDIVDIEAMCERGLVEKARLLVLFEEIRPALVRFPAIDATTFAQSVHDFCN